MPTRITTTAGTAHFYYLTGFREPEAVLAIVLGKKPRHILFCRDKNLEREIWDGFRFGPAGGQGSVRLRRGLSDRRTGSAHSRSDGQSGRHPYADRRASPRGINRVTRWLNAVRAKVRTGVTAPAELRDVRTPVATDAPHQGRGRDRHHGARREDFRRTRMRVRCALQGRACMNTRSRPRCCMSS